MDEWHLLAGTKWVHTKSAWELHIVLQERYERLQNFETAHQKGVSKLLKKARTANPLATRLLAVTQWHVFLWKGSNHKETTCWKLSKMCDKNSWGLCQRSSHKKIRSAHPFEGARYDLAAWEAHYHVTCWRDYTLKRMTDTRTPSKTLKPLKSKLPTRPHIFSTSNNMLQAAAFRDERMATLRQKYETGTFHMSSL